MKRLKTGLHYLLVVFFVSAGLNHFRIPDFYTSIMPDYFPARGFLVYLSGVTEIVAGVMLAVPRFSRWGAWFIIAHLVVFFSVHVWMIQESERYVNDTVTIEALWFRIVLQLVMIAWAYWFTIQPKEKAARE